jgi:hypothetical protein
MENEDKKPTFIKQEKHRLIKQRALDKNQTIFDVLDEVISKGLRVLKIEDIKTGQKNNESSKNNSKN